jgi:DNA repair exonuclease SbcCD ATPase subunit
MGAFDSLRKKNEEVTKGSQKPRNLDVNNDVIKKAEEKAESIQKILKGWERNLPQIEKLIKAIAKAPNYDYESRVYQAKRILRKWGGDQKLAKRLVDKYL